MPNDTTNTAPDERDELKPCPFCGGRAATDIPPQRRQVECHVCGAAVYNRAAWNTRTPPQVKPLVWADTDDYGQKSDDYQWCECQTIIGDYAVGKHPDASFWAWYDPEDGPIGDSHACLSAAKAAAQADYTRRILDALA